MKRKTFFDLRVLLMSVAFTAMLGASMFAGAALTSSITTNPQTAGAGQSVTVIMQVQNIGDIAADYVQPVPVNLTMTGSGFAYYSSGPAPANIPVVAPSGSGEFTWIFSALGNGNVTFMGSATGTEEGTGNTITSAVAQSTPILILTVVPTGTVNPSTNTPTNTFTTVPTNTFTTVPTSTFTTVPTNTFTTVPTSTFTAVPTNTFTTLPTNTFTTVPTSTFTTVPTNTFTTVPTSTFTAVPTNTFTTLPTNTFTTVPTAVPTNTYTTIPTNIPTVLPTATASVMPTSITTPAPTAIPTVQASASITSGSVINTADGDSVEIGYSLKSPSRVRIIIYDRNGKPVNTLVSATMSAGTYNASWSGVFEDGKTVGAGIYIIYVKIGTLEKKLKVAVEK